jgi:hypothetical protein
MTRCDRGKVQVAVPLGTGGRGQGTPQRVGARVEWPLLDELLQPIEDSCTLRPTDTRSVLLPGLQRLARDLSKSSSQCVAMAEVSCEG